MKRIISLITALLALALIFASCNRKEPEPEPVYVKVKEITHDRLPDPTEGYISKEWEYNRYGAPVYETDYYDGSFEQRYSYAYDEDGRLVNRDHLDENGVKVGGESYTYAEGIQPTAYYVYGSDEKGELYISYWDEKVYDEFGRISQEKHYSSDGRLTHTNGYEYDNDGNLVREYSLDEKGELMSERLTAYKNGLVSEVKAYYLGGLEFYYTQEHDEGGFITKRTEYEPDGNVKTVTEFTRTREKSWFNEELEVDVETETTYYDEGTFYMSREEYNDRHDIIYKAIQFPRNSDDIEWTEYIYEPLVEDKG